MAGYDEITVGTIKQCWNDLMPVFQDEWDRMEAVNDWITVSKDRLKPRIWSGVAEQDWGKLTIYNIMPYAVNTTVLALFTARRPQITVAMRNRRQQQELERANFNERAGHAVLHAIDRNRPRSLEDEVKFMLISRGVGIIKRCWLNQEERGEERTPQSYVDYGEQAPTDPTSQMVYTEETGTYEDITREGDFPVYAEVLDPLDCVYQLGSGTNGPSLFIHHYLATWGDIMEAFPGIESKEGYGAWKKSQEVPVYDYWDKEVHAVVVQDIFCHPPTPHGYKTLPFEIERVNEDTVRRNSRRSVSTLADLGEGALSTERIATPLVWPMLDNVTWASFGESLLASYLPDLATTPIVHRGIASGNSGGRASPYFRIRELADGRVTDSPVYSFRGTKGAGGRPIWPLFDNEHMHPLEPVPIADHLSVFLQARSRQMEMVSFGLEFLTGVLKAELSGYSAAQQKQLSIARTEPYRKALNRLMSRFMSGCFELMADEWDRGGVPLVLQALTQEDIELSREVVANIGSVTYEIVQIVPSDVEAERQAIFQAHAVGLMSDEEAIENLAFSDDPQTTLKKVIYDQVRKQNPDIAMNMVAQFAEETGRPSPFPQQPPPAPAAPPMGAAPVPPGLPPVGPPPGGAPPPMDPMAAMMGGAPPAGPVAAGVPPELEAMMQDPAMMEMLMQMLAGQGNQG